MFNNRQGILLYDYKNFILKNTKFQLQNYIDIAIWCPQLIKVDVLKAERHTGSWTNRPFAKSALGKSAPKKVGPRQIGPLKKSALGKSAPKSETSRKKNIYHIYLFT